MRSLPALLLLATLGVACSDQATEPARQSPTLAANFMNNPDVGNGAVYRYGSEFAVCWTDFGNGLRACHRTQQFPAGDCGAFDPIGPIGVQDVVLVEDPDDFFASEIVSNAMGRVWMTVRDLNQAGTCYGALRVAEGWGEFHYTDNDVFGAQSGDPSTNAWGYMARGDLTASDGSPVAYNGHARYSYVPGRGFRGWSQQVNVR